MDTMDIHEIQKRYLELWISFLDFMDIQMDIQKEYFGYPKRVMDIRLAIF